MLVNKDRQNISFNPLKKNKIKYFFDYKNFFLKPLNFRNKFSAIESDNFIIKLVQTKSELKKAQALRYSVFYKEKKAKPTLPKKLIRLDYDKIDKFADHLIVIDKNRKNKIVGTYRLIRGDVAELYGGYYSSTEFNLINIVNNYQNKHILELGRSCVHQNYRNGTIMNLLWKAIAEYVKLYDIKVLIGCASFSGTDPIKYSEELTYLRDNFSLPANLSVESYDNNIYPAYKLNNNNNSNPLRTFAKLPPLIKGYLRVGGKVSDNFFVDYRFNTIDLFVVVCTDDIDTRYKKKILKLTCSKISLMKDYI